MMIWMIFNLCEFVMATNLSAIAPNNRGVEALRAENEFKAYKNLVDAAAADSFDPTIHLNLGLTYMRNKEPEKALQEFKLAEELAGDKPDLQFMARFNQGVVLTEKSEIDGALAAYQAALELNPQSQETKTNIELLWQGQGGGKDGKKDQDQKGNQDQKQQQGENDQPQDPKEDPNQKPDEKKEPKPFDSKDLTPETVRKILEELKQQEQKVRADHYSKGAKERPRGKDW